MNATEIKIIRTNIQAQITNKLVAPLCIAGVPGTGKSTQVQLLADELDMHLVTESAPCLSVESLSGLPEEYDAPQYQPFAIDGTVPKATAWSIPELIAKTLRAAESKPTILLLDDFHMVPAYLQSYFYALLLERRMGNFKLPDNVAIILTMNDSQEAGFNGIGSAVRNRLSILAVEFNFDHWLDTYGRRLNYLVASFLRAKPHFCIEPESTGIEGYASARAWTAIANEIDAHNPDDLNSIAGRIAGMQVTSAASQAFHTHVNYVNSIDFVKTVKSRTLTDLSQRDPLDSIIYAYITNFINSVQDGVYLFELMQANKDQSTFIGFVFGEIYTKYRYNSEDKPLSEGIQFVIDRLLNQPLDYSKYPNTAKKTLDEAFSEPIEGLHTFMQTAQEYLL